MIDLEQPERRYQVEEIAGLVSNVPARLGEPTGQLVMPDQLESQQNEMQGFERREIVLIQNLVDEEQLVLFPARPGELGSRPVNEFPLKRLALRQADRLMFGQIGQKLLSRANHGRTGKCRLIILHGLEQKSHRIFIVRLVAKQANDESAGCLFAVFKVRAPNVAPNPTHRALAEFFCF